MEKRNQNNYDKDIEWANWSPAIKQLNDQLEEVRKIGENMYYNANLINVYLSKLQNIRALWSSALSNKQSIKNRLNDLQKQLYGKSYLSDMEYIKEYGIESMGKQRRVKFKEFQSKCIIMLLNICEEMCQDFSDCKLRPKIDRREKRNPGKAIMHMH